MMKRFFSKNTPPRLKTIRGLYQLLGWQIGSEKAREVDRAFPELQDPTELAYAILLSKDILGLVAPKAFQLHLYLIHQARLKMIRALLPQASEILDLGGAYAPLHKMGYAHPFNKLTLIDLPPNDRHEEFQREVPMEDHRVVLKYEDMTKLSSVGSNSIDLVWSGQSIEHISVQDAQRMSREILRVLKPGGSFCLDTPNGLISSVHALTAGQKFLHPDHKIEYSPDQLRMLIQESGFEIHESWGICEMPITAKTGVFTYDDFLHGGAITNNIDGAYIQFIHARKPMLHEAG